MIRSAASMVILDFWKLFCAIERFLLYIPCRLLSEARRASVVAICLSTRYIPCRLLSEARRASVVAICLSTRLLLMDAITALQSLNVRQANLISELGKGDHALCKCKGRLSLFERL